MRDRTPNVCLLLALAISAASIQAAARSTWAADRADLAFLPTLLAFEGVASGDSAAGAVVVHNGGVDTIMVASTYFAAGGQSPFSVWPEAFGISPGDTVQLNVVYKPAAPGSWTDVLLLGASAVGESLLPAPGVGLSGRGAGQALQAVPGQLQFASSMVGVTDTATVLLRSVGGDTVRIRGLTFSDSRFSTGTDSLDLAPGEDRELAVVYTPSTGTSVSGAMSFDLADSASVPIVSLDAAAAAMGLETDAFQALIDQ